MEALNNLTPDRDARQMRRSESSLHLVRAASDIDARGYAVTGASAAASAAWERAFAACQSWRGGADHELATALREAPRFTMAHVMQAYQFVCSRDPARVRAAGPALTHAAELPANERERMHISAIGAIVADDYERARDVLTALLHQYPRDALALQVAHMIDYLAGDAECLRQRVEAVLPAWSSELPGYHAILAMHAFGLEEAGDYERAEERAEAALELNASDARAHHVKAHVFEMTERPADGVRWMGRHSANWGVDTIVATHCWWHLSLFHLALGEPGRALEVYDKRIRAGGSAAIADLIDASALLWRVQLHSSETNARWAELADAWAPHIDDRFCSFNDVHAMLAFVGAGDWERAARFERVLAGCQARPNRHGEMTRLLGLPACRALIAFGRGDNTLALTMLASLPALAHRLGGSHAQRDVLNLTMLEAIERLRRPARGRNGTSRGQAPVVPLGV
jgi:tetratricopeptide (TPR) repeat protein